MNEKSNNMEGKWDYDMKHVAGIKSTERDINEEKSQTIPSMISHLCQRDSIPEPRPIFFSLEEYLFSACTSGSLQEESTKTK